MNIINSLFGIKKTFYHPVLGNLKSQRIKSNDSTKNYTWYGSILLNKESHETTIIMEGNNETPYQVHLNCVSDLIEKWETEYLPKIVIKVNEIVTNRNEKYSNFKDNFYLSAVYPMSEKNAKFELTLESINSEKTDCIGVEIKNYIITKIQMY